MSGPAVFLSYSREDAANAAAVEADLSAAGCDVWRDLKLSGGEDWWNAILDRIRRADVFVTLISATSVTSVPCARELAYAMQLGRPVLPLRTGTADSVGVLPTEFATRQILDYADDKASALRLVRALRELPPAPALPDPLPDPPEVPLSYTSELASVLHAPRELTAAEQFTLLGRLRAGFLDPEVDDDCRALLVVLRRRSDLLAQVAGEIDALLARPDGAAAGHGARTGTTVGNRAVRQSGPRVGLATRLPHHPVLAPLWCAGWLLWVAVHLMSGNASDYMSVWFGSFAAASALAAGVEWTWLRGHELWLLAVAVNGVVIVPVLVSPTTDDQTVTLRAAVTVLVAGLLVVAVRARTRVRDHDETSLVVYLVFMVAAHGLLLAAAVAALAGKWALESNLRFLVVYPVLGAAGVCGWLAVLSRIAATSTTPPAPAQAR